MMKRIQLLSFLFAALGLLSPALADDDEWELEDDDLDFPDDEDPDEDSDEDSDEDDDPNIQRESDTDEDDVENWSFEGETVEKVEEKVEEKRVGRDLQPEPKRYGNSGNWYEVTSECVDCPTLLGQEFGIERSDVMRQFFDFVQIASDRKSGKFVYPSIGENRPMGISDKSKRVVMWMYIIDTGTRLTDTYATLWDLEVMADGGLAYGRKYEVQAWTDDAYADWEKGYQADQGFISSRKLLSYADLAPVRELSTKNARFQVGEDARINFVGYAAFVRSDVNQDSISAAQTQLREDAEKEAKRIRDQKEYYAKGTSLLDDKEYEDALSAFLKSQDLGGDSLDLNYNLGFTYYMLREYDRAKKYYRLVLDADPRDTDVRYNLARIFEKERDWDSAIREYQAILKFDPDDNGTRNRLQLLKQAREMIQ
jgi:tetratricopeptide (TPR) repeat protein